MLCVQTCLNGVHRTRQRQRAATRWLQSALRGVLRGSHGSAAMRSCTSSGSELCSAAKSTRSLTDPATSDSSFIFIGFFLLF